MSVGSLQGNALEAAGFLAGGALVFAADGELRHTQRDLGVGDLLDVEALHEVATGGPSD